MPTTTTVVGGSHTITWDVPQNVLAAASQALNQLTQGFPSAAINVITDPSQVGQSQSPVTLPIYDVPGGSTLIPSIGEYAVILSDDPANTTVQAVGSHDLIIDNNAAANNLSITGPGTVPGSNGGEFIGSGTVIAGNGNDTITVKGDASIVAGNGADSITVQLGNATINVGTGNDTITLGGLNDTVTAAGSATVAGPGSLSATVIGGQLLFQNGAGGESVTAGSGSATLMGGSNVTFLGGSGNTHMLGVGNDTFVGGVGSGSSDTMTGSGSGNLFSFETGTQPELGTHVITNFVPGNDFIHLGSGYDVTSILANNTTVSGGVTTISLDGGLTLIKVNATLHSTDFK